MKSVRQPAVAGMFYPASEKELRELINLLLDTTVTSQKFENIFGIISPHAGYAYSGKTAAFVYNLLKDKNYSTVIIISPSHREYFQGISIFNGEAYETPLGKVFVNKELSQKLVDSSDYISFGTEGHSRQEHALEVQLPFLQSVLKDFSIVPMVIGDQRRKFVDELGEKLTEFVDESTLIIASSDLSHFHSKEIAEKLDSIVADRIEQMDYEKLQDDFDTGKCEACGGGGIVALLKAADIRNIGNAKVLSRSDSGDVLKENSDVVGYLSAVIYG